jgi:protease I
MKLTGKRGIILAEDLYEDLELWYPLLRLRGAGVEMQVVGTGSADVYKSKHGYPVQVDMSADSISSSEVDVVVIPGGYAPDRMRRYPEVVQLVRESFQKGKLVAAICHGGWLLASAGILKDRQVTSFFAIKDDLVNAGASWVDERVVQDENLITSRTPSDLPAFTDAIIAALAGVEPGDLKGVTAETDALEALRLAVRAEEEAIQFYSRAVKRTEDPEAKNIFHQLAKEEERHRAIVQDEYRRLTADPEWDRYGIWREVL